MKTPQESVASLAGFMRALQNGPINVAHEIDKFVNDMPSNNNKVKTHVQWGRLAVLEKEKKEQRAKFIMLLVQVLVPLFAFAVFFYKVM